VPESQPSPNTASAQKTALRDQLVTARNRMSLAEIGAASRDLAAVVLDAPEVRRAATLAAYVSIGREPGTGALLDALADAGKRVILPVLQPDGDLDWGVHDGAAGLVPARLGLLEPAGPLLGVDAVTGADVLLVPGIAVSSTGMRMGRGGGSYDRALARVPAGTFTCVLLYDGEVGVDVPAEPHDRRVGAAATPTRLVRF